MAVSFAARVPTLVAVALLCTAVHANDYVVIVHPENRVESLTGLKLTRIFKAQTQEWDGGESLVLLLPRSSTKEKKVLLARVYEMDEIALKKYWTELIYQNRISEQPSALPSAAVTLQVVAKTRGAIAIVDQRDLDPRVAVKVIAIDGRHAGDLDYLLHTTEQVESNDNEDPAPEPQRDARDAAFAGQDPSAGTHALDLEQRVSALEAQLEDRNSPSDSPTLSLRGFGDVRYTTEQIDPDGAGESSDNAFALGQLDLFLTSRLSQRWSFLNETVFEANDQNETVVDVERLIIKYRSSDALSIEAGRFHTTLGWWNEYFHHGEWLQTSIDRPSVLAFEDAGGVLPVHLVGLVFKGRAEIEGCGVDWTLETGNGRGPTPDPPQVVNDANDSKAFNFAVRFSPANPLGLEFGSALYIDDVPTNADPTAGPLHGSFDEQIANAFVVWRHKSWEAELEYFDIRHDGSKAQSSGWYAQLAHRFGDWTPYGRVDALMIDDADPYYLDLDDQLTWSLGVRKELNPWCALKVQVNATEVDAAPGGNDESRRALVVQTAFAF